MRIVAIVVVLLSGLTGCASQSESGYFWFGKADEAPSVREQVRPPEGSGLEYRPDSRDIEMYRDRQPSPGFQDPLQTGYSPGITHKALNDYAEQLAMSLMDGAVRLNTEELIGIASFVRYNRTLRETTVLGNQLSEYLIHELQLYGLSVVDFKLSRTLDVTEQGDLALTREGQRLAKRLQMHHILTGTLVELPRGVNVNARIVAVDQQRVVASATIFIPSFVVTSLVQTAALKDE